MDWIKNVISYYESGDAGECPVCGSRNVEVMEHKNGKRKSVTFVCKDCRVSEHFDGISETAE